MSRRAWAFIWTVLLVGVALSALALTDFSHSRSDDLLPFTVLTALATFAQLFEAEAPGRQSFYFHTVFFFAGMLLLHPFFFALLILIPHVIEWAKARLVKGPHLRAWYIQPFNIASHIIAGFGGYFAYGVVEANVSATLFLTLSPVLAATAAVLAYVAINHLLVGRALVLARGLSWRASGVFDLESLLPDLILCYLGYIVSVLWELNPWLTLPALSPLVLMYRALMIPQLKQEAQTDGKTGLWNARHFSTLFTAEMDRARRFSRPLTVIMADLDLLRNINNTYGHLAGDVVLSGIGAIIRQNVREYDIAGRFGGEEFAIVLPETPLEEARALCERLRAAVEAAGFPVSTSQAPIHVTMSLGVACFPDDATGANDLVHAADVAVYQAKLKGRNCVVCSSDVPHSLELTTGPLEDRLSPSYSVTFVPRPEPMDGVVSNNGHAHHVPSSTQAPANAAAEAPSRDAPRAAAPELPNEIPLTPDSSQFATELAAAGNPPAAVTVTGLSSVVHRPSSIPAPVNDADAGERAIQVIHPPELSTAPLELPREYPEMLLRLFVATVIVAGVAMTVLGFVRGDWPDYTVIGLLTALAVAAEFFQVKMYGENTISVSVGVAFAAALIAGIPGVAFVSAGIALTHYVQRRPPLYKAAFNWSMHVLAGLAPALAPIIWHVQVVVSDLPLLVSLSTLAAPMYYMTETGLLTAVISLSSGRSAVGIWRDQFKWLATHYVVLCGMGLFLDVAYTALGPLGVLVFVLPVFMMRFSQKQYVDRTEESMRELERMNHELANANSEVLRASRSIKELNDELFVTLSKIIDARDPYVSSHAAKVADYATAIALELGLPADRLEPVRQAGFLHDIGKIGISEQVLHKPSKLTADEYEYIKTHAALGGEFVETCRGLRHLAPFVRHHHEWWDGGGYPDALAGEDIPLEARILAVCDAVEAMASDRPYRRGMSLDEVISEVKRCAGTQFDPTVARAFVKIAEQQREHLVINSAQELLRRQSDYPDLAHPGTNSPLPSRGPTHSGVAVS